MGSGCVWLSPWQEVSEFKKLWLPAEVLESYKTTSSPGGPGQAGSGEGLGCIDNGPPGIISLSPQLQPAPGSGTSLCQQLFTVYLQS